MLLFIKGLLKSKTKGLFGFLREMFIRKLQVMTLPVDGTEEYAAAFWGFRANMTVLLCPEKWLSLHRSFHYLFHYLVAISDACRNRFYIF